MAIVAGALSLLLGAVPTAIGSLFFLSPAFRKKEATESTFIDMGSLLLRCLREVLLNW